jgi:hypothetical protein
MNMTKQPEMVIQALSPELIIWSLLKYYKFVIKNENISLKRFIEIRCEASINQADILIWFAFY